jgi:uncharacterized membrane protein YjjP (DUF1212 family)
VVLRVGRLSLSSGTGSYRVKASMERIAKALGIERHEAHVTLTEITATSHRDGRFRTEVAEVRRIGVNTDRLAEMERLAQWAERQGSCSVEEIEAELDRIEAKPPRWSPTLNAVWAGLACVAFAFLNNAGPVEMMGAFIGAALGQAVRRFLVYRAYNQFGSVMLAATIASGAYIAFVRFLEATNITDSPHEIGYVAAVLFLVPGFPLVTGALDLAKSDFSAGISRLVYAMMVFFSAAAALWVISITTGLSPAPPTPWIDNVALLQVSRLAMSALGVLGFALMFNGTRRLGVSAAVIAMVPNTLRLFAVTSLHWPPQLAAGLGALSIGLLTKLVARRIHVPKITVYVPAVTIMVPGISAYRAVYYLAEGESADALLYGVQAALVVTALAMGLAIARMLTDRAWRFDR